MHLNFRRVIPVVIVLVVLAVIAYWYFELRPAQQSNDTLTASGTIEAAQLQISPEVSGKITQVLASEGDEVHAGDKLVQLDSTLLDAQRAQAAAALSVAQANAAAAAANLEVVKTGQPAAESALAAAQAARDAASANQALLKAGATEEQVKITQAQLDQAEANLKALEGSFYTLTSAYRPEVVSAAWERLTQARQEYYGLSVVLTPQQIEDLRTAMTTAQSNLTQTEARKTELEKDSRTPPGGLKAASVAITDAQAALEAATQAYDATQNSEQPFYEQIEAARISWDLAQLNLSQAKARYATLDADPNMIQETLDAAESSVDDAQILVDDTQVAYDTLVDSDQADQLDKAWDEAQDALTDLNAMGRGTTITIETLLNQLSAATAQREASAASLTNLQNGARPEQLDAAQAQVDAAQAQVEAAQVQVEAAQSRVDAARDQMDAAQAQVAAAQAALDILDVQIDKLAIVSPVDGVVLTRVVEPGEIALPYATLLIVGVVDDRSITVYVPEDRYGEVSVGQEATVSVDSFPGVSFKAVVSNISEQAEFTPRNVQTAEGRKNTVFAIRLKIVESDNRLKPGMPADVTFK
jgi:multidrug resistance efflux pump